MTPVLSAVYDELLSRAQASEDAGEFEAWVRRFLQRTGSFSPDHESAARRLDAAREDALCRGGWAARMTGTLVDPAEQSLAALLPCAHRGAFTFLMVGAHRLMQDLISGASFLVVPRDNVGREVIGDNLGAVCVGRLVAAADGCAVLPGVVFHRADATPHIQAVTQEARDRGMSADEICDALLRMDHALQTLSRVRASFAYRAEALEYRDATQTPMWRRREAGHGSHG